MDTAKDWLVGLLLACMLVFGLGYSYKWVYDKGIEHQKNVDIVAQAQANKDAMVKYDRISQELEDERKKSKTVYRTITREVEKIVANPIYNNDCIDTDGLQLYNSSLQGANPNGASTGVPATNSSNGKDGS